MNKNNLTKCKVRICIENTDKSKCITSELFKKLIYSIKVIIKFKKNIIINKYLYKIPYDYFYIPGIYTLNELKNDIHITLKFTKEMTLSDPITITVLKQTNF